MKRITLSVMQWSLLQDLRDVAPLDDADVACMHELRDVLARHGRLGRFALHLVHRHFELTENEVLVEYSDPAVREQRLRVEPRAGASLRNAIPTTWMFDAERPLVACVCASSDGKGHLGRHESS